MFVVHVAALELLEPALHPSQTPLIATLQQDKAFTKIPPKYMDYANIFSLDLVTELPENIGINKHAIKLVEKKQPPYGSIYRLSLVELETLKTYIETHLKTGFILPFKSLIDALIFFNK